MAGGAAAGWRRARPPPATPAQPLLAVATTQLFEKEDMFADWGPDVSGAGTARL